MLVTSVGGLSKVNSYPEFQFIIPDSLKGHEVPGDWVICSHSRATGTKQTPKKFYEKYNQ